MTIKRIRSANEVELTHKSPQNHPSIANDSEPDSAVQLQQRLPPAQRGAVINQVVVAEFLKHCYNCKKTIPAGSAVYMYRDFCAFCSAECRGIMIRIDDAAVKAAAAKTKTSTRKKAHVHQEEKVIWEL